MIGYQWSSKAKSFCTLKSMQQDNVNGPVSYKDLGGIRRPTDCTFLVVLHSLLACCWSLIINNCLSAVLYSSCALKAILHMPHMCSITSEYYACRLGTNRICCYARAQKRPLPCTCSSSTCKTAEFTFMHSVHAQSVGVILFLRSCPMYRL